MPHADSPAGRPVSAPPLPLRLAVWVWGLGAVLLAVAAVSFFISAGTQLDESAPVMTLSAVLLGIAIVVGVLLLGIRRGRRRARQTLSTIGLLVGVPFLLRGFSVLWVACAAMIVAVVLMWLPVSGRYFRLRDTAGGRR